MGAVDLPIGDLRTEYKHFYGGANQDSTTNERIAVEYPYTEEEWATVPNGTETDVDRAMKAAREAFDEWSNSPPSKRRDVLLQIADAMEAHADELGRMETLQNGRLITESIPSISGIAEWFRYYAGLTDKIEGEVIELENKGGQFFNYTLKEPLGIVGAITPWNAPLALTTNTLAPALASGNVVVQKPSSIAPVSTLRFAEIVQEESDIPEGVYNVLGGDSGLGEHLTDHDDIDKLAFTGSVSVGREIGRKAGEKIIPATLELGGKSPNIIFPNANLDAAVPGSTKAIFVGAGQGCIAGSRIVVHEDVADEFVDRFVEYASNIELGDPLDEDTQMGPISYRSQWEDIKEYIEIGRDEGATLAYGGAVPDDEGCNMIEPTIFTDVDNSMTIAQEEIFGPVVTVTEFSTEEEAIDIANDTDFGLAAGIWSENPRQIHRVAAELEAGTIYVNEYRRSSYATPFGGYKESGIGRHNGQEAIEEYMQSKSVWLDMAGDVEDVFKMG